MMRWIVSTSIRFRFLVVALGGAMMLFGVTQLREMPVDVFPEFAPPKVEIQTVTLGLTPEETETLVTVPAGAGVGRRPDLDVLRSRSLGQLSQIEMIFDPGTDLILSRQLVQERLQSVAPNLPTWAAPPVMLQPLSSTSRVMKIGISSRRRLGDRPVDDGVLEDPRPPAAGARRGQRGDLGRAHRHAGRPGRAGAAAGQKDITLDQVMESTVRRPRLRAPAVHERLGRRQGRLHRHRQPAAHRPPHPADRSSRPSWPRSSWPSGATRSIRIGDVAKVVKDHQAAHRRRGHRRRPRPHDDRREAALGEHARRHARASRTPSTRCGPGLPGFNIDTTIFRPATFVRGGAQQPRRRRWCSARCSS